MTIWEDLLQAENTDDARLILNEATQQMRMHHSYMSDIYWSDRMIGDLLKYRLSPNRFANAATLQSGLLITMFGKYDDDRVTRLQEEEEVEKSTRAGRQYTVERDRRVAAKKMPSPPIFFHTFNVMLITCAAALQMLFSEDSEIVKALWKVQGVVKDREQISNQ